MLKTALYLAAASSFLMAASGSSMAADSRDLIGTWTWTMPKPACTMTRTFSADGKVQIVNGQKRTSGTYVVKENRARTGRQMIYTVTSDEGGTDCDGTSGNTTGSRYAAYLDIDGSSMRLCLDSAKSSCMGPYRKR